MSLKYKLFVKIPNDLHFFDSESASIAGIIHLKQTKLPII